MSMDGAVFPDAVRGMWSALDGVDLLGYTLRPTVHLAADVFEPVTDSVWVHVQRDSATVGDVDRLEDVRCTVYGPDVLTSTELSEAIIALLSGEAIETPESELSGRGFFDEVSQRGGPVPVDYPNTDVIPTMFVLTFRARPTN